MIKLKQSEARTLPVMLIDSTDHISPKTGIVEGDTTVQISKNGGALGAFDDTGKWTELGQGLYTIDFAIGDLNTVGFFAYLVTSAGCDQYSGMMYVDSFSDYKADVSSLPTASEIQTELEEDGASILDTLQDRLTATRAGYLDELDFGLTEAIAALSGYVDCLPVALNDPTAAAIADAVWDEVLTGATHNLPTSSGRRLRQAADVLIIREETCQAGGADNEIILDAAASAVDDFYINDIIILESGTGAGEARHIDSYVGATKTATVNRDWTTNPDATTEFIIRADSTKHVHGFEAEALSEINAEVDTALTDYGGTFIDDIWDELLADHQDEDSMGEALADAREITLEED